MNSFPWLQYLPSCFPGADSKKIASDGYKHAMAMYEQPYKMTKKKLVSQDSLSSVAFIESCL